MELLLREGDSDWGLITCPKPAALCLDLWGSDSVPWHAHQPSTMEHHSPSASAAFCEVGFFFLSLWAEGVVCRKGLLTEEVGEQWWKPVTRVKAHTYIHTHTLPEWAAVLRVPSEQHKIVWPAQEGKGMKDHCSKISPCFEISSLIDNTCCYHSYIYMRNIYFLMNVSSMEWHSLLCSSALYLKNIVLLQ